LLSLISNAYAQGQAAPAGGTGGGLSMLILPAAILVIFYFLLIRPNQKKEKDRKKMIESLQKGDKVITTGGIYGVVVNIKKEDDIIVLKIGDGAKVDFAKSAVQMKLQ
jgi:preprotein translocase subunit YajC